MTTKFRVGSFFFAALFSASILFAAETKTDHSADGKASASAATAPADAVDPTTNTIPDTVHIKGRLPNGWGKLGLTDLQRQAIYKIQATYNSQISVIEAKRDAEMRKVLTTAQQNLLAEQAEAKAASKASKKDIAADDKTDPSAPAATTKKSKTTTKSPSSSSDSAAAVAETK